MIGMRGLGQAGGELPGEAGKEGEPCVGESRGGGSSSCYRTTASASAVKPIRTSYALLSPGRH